MCKELSTMLDEVKKNAAIPLPLKEYIVNNCEHITGDKPSIAFYFIESMLKKAGFSRF
jgi:hypothetical protein